MAMPEILQPSWEARQSNTDEAEALVLRERLRRTAEECDALISILNLKYMACTEENVIDCLQAIVRVAKGEDRR